MDKVTKLLAPTVPLVLEVEGPEQSTLKLELQLAWTTRGIIIMEQKLRDFGLKLNVLQDPGSIWRTMDLTTLTTAIWALSQSRVKTYADEAGFDVIASFITPDNQAAATDVLQSAFLESLSTKRREDIKKAIAEAEVNAGEKQTDPTPAPA